MKKRRLLALEPVVQGETNTFSIAARDPITGEMGVAVQSHYFSVGSSVTWAEAGVGVVATQAYGGADLGPLLIDLLWEGQPAAEALEAGLRQVEGYEFRQAAVLDAQGRVAAYTGKSCTPEAGHITGDNVSCQANVMLNDQVWPAMKRAYESAQGDLADRLVAALEGGQAVGGDLRGQLSAAILIVSGEKQSKRGLGRLMELRVEEHPKPIEELRRLVKHSRAHGFLRRARVLGMNGQFKEVAEAMRQALEMVPDQMEFRFYLAVGLFGAGEEAKAIRIFKEVFSLQPQWAELVPRLVSRHMVADDPQVIRKILAQQPKK